MAEMERVALPGGVELSRIVYGMWRLADDDTSPDHIRAKVEACLEQGITTMDQADIYGGYQAEELFGAALKGSGLRDRIEIVTKCDIVAPVGRHADARVKHYDTSRAHIEAAIEDSLRLMGIDVIDLLLLHRPDPLMDPAETGAALDDAVKAGKVRAVGVSNFRPPDWTLLAGAMETPLSTNQIEVSLARTEPFTNGDIAFLQERGIVPMAWSPLGGGALVGSMVDARLRTLMSGIAQDQGVDMSSVAIAWLLRHPARIMPVMGTNNLDRIGRLAEAASVKLDRETWFELYEAARGHEVP